MFTNMDRTNDTMKTRSADKTLTTILPFKLLLFKLIIYVTSNKYKAIAITMGIKYKPNMSPKVSFSKTKFAPLQKKP